MQAIRTSVRETAANGKRGIEPESRPAGVADFARFRERRRGAALARTALRRTAHLGDEFVMPDGTRIVVSHAGVSELVRSPSFIKGVGKGRYRPPMARTTPAEDAELFALGSDVGPQLTALDPPDHTCLQWCNARSCPASSARLRK